MAEEKSAVVTAERKTATATNTLENAIQKKTQTMEGFSEWTNIVDYIKGSTHSIWDMNNIGYIYRDYTPTTQVHTSDGRTFGRDIVITNSLTKMAAFPDIRDYVEDVIWTGNDQDGYHTSMRWTWIATNTGRSIYGPATGKRVVVSGIANCVVKDAKIIEEWVAYNELSLIRQLGLDVNEVLAQQLSQDPPAIESDGRGQVERLIGQAPPKVLPPKATAGFVVEDFIRRSTHEIWNWRMFGKVNEYYAENYLCHTASDRELYGIGDLKQDIIARIAAFPDASMHIDDLYWMGNEEEGFKAAVRWSFIGTNTGPSRYGAPTGKRVRIMGISNYIIKNGKFVEEYTEYGEFNLMKQLCRP
ncbi:ester cyclase [Peribacillus muralis]|uniref:ester cyclase n=1 Tax=Peribacillus muralis TaxID=264697 RepID=UPI00070D90C2|nr:ester cyclase [Peribacillus muralis]